MGSGQSAERQERRPSKISVDPPLMVSSAVLKIHHEPRAFPRVRSCPLARLLAGSRGVTCVGAIRWLSGTGNACSRSARRGGCGSHAPIRTRWVSAACWRSIRARRPLVGSHDYGITLPLAPREVVLTFDDGPRPPYTNRVLKALADECLRATFFVLGRQARAHPADGAPGPRRRPHGRHPHAKPSDAPDVAGAGDGRKSKRASPRSATRWARGSALAPFFRFPGLYRTSAAEPICARAA